MSQQGVESGLSLHESRSCVVTTFTMSDKRKKCQMLGYKVKWPLGPLRGDSSGFLLGLLALKFLSPDYKTSQLS